MADSNSQLNQLLIRISRCLLQYAGECWPWTNAHSHNEKAAIDRLVERQRSHAAAIAELLDGRRQIIDFGTYPTEFTDLHFIGLNFLLAQIVEDQQQVAGDVSTAVANCTGDIEAVELLNQIEAGEREILAELKKLAEPTPAPSA